MQSYVKCNVYIRKIVLATVKLFSVVRLLLKEIYDINK